METHHLESWDGFRPLIDSIREKYGWLRITKDYAKKNVVLFRGHGNSDWPLATTLERCTSEEFSVDYYMFHSCSCSKELESLTGKKWDIPDFPAIEKMIKENQDTFRVYLPCYDYLVYLRHHGFPSPLLDWTASPFIAAYFAYHEKPTTDSVAIYVFIESPAGVKGGTGGSPQIQLMGPYVTTHSRHFAQKAWYTIATKYDYKCERHIFCPHKDVFNRSRKEQDILIKITLPASERIKALADLNEYNINHFTLFQTEDALVRAMAIKEFELDVT